MRNALLATTMLVCGSGIAHAQSCAVPGPAAAVGYTTQTMGGAASGNFVPFSYYGVGGISSSANADGSVTVNPSGDNYGAQLMSPGAYGGGGYFQVTMNDTGNKSFWANDMEEMLAMSNGQTPPNNSWIEADMAEFDNPGLYGGALHNWYGASGGNQAVSTYASGSPFSTSLTGTHTYGFLWVMATASSQGYVEWYLDGSKVGNRMSWNQYQAGQSPQDNPYAVIDSRHLQLILGTGADNSTTFSNPQVWQANATADIGVTAPSSPCASTSSAVISSSTSAVAPDAVVALATAKPTSIQSAAASTALSSTAPLVPITTTAASAIATGTDTSNPLPGNGSMKDCSGNTWAITSDTRITENGVLVTGGGDTSMLVMQSCAVMGLSNGKNGSSTNWFTMGSDNPTSIDGWAVSEAPTNLASGGTTTPAADPTTPATPPPTVSAPVCAGTPTGTAFRVVNGRIVGPNGDWIARGVNLYGNQDPMTVARLVTQTFKGVNMLRYIVRPMNDPASYQAFVSEMTAQGIVVEFEDHPDGGGAQDSGPPGGIPAESAWYAAMAKMYANNPYVWFGTFNEPASFSGLSAWQRATYDAVRSASNTIILIEVSGSRPANLQQALNPAVYADMKNVVWDAHYYGYINNYGSDPSDITSTIKGMITAAQTIKSADGVMPVLIGESGPSTTGLDLDPNGIATVEGLVNLASTGTMGGLAQFVWYPGFSTPNSLTDANGTPTSPYGQKAQLYIGVTTVSCTAAQTAANAQTALGQIAQQTPAISTAPPASN